MEMAVMAPTLPRPLFLGRPVQPSCTGAPRRLSQTDRWAGDDWKAVRIVSPKVHQEFATNTQFRGDFSEHPLYT
jgi:hypothetical protein